MQQHPAQMQQQMRQHQPAMCDPPHPPVVATRRDHARDCARARQAFWVGGFGEAHVLAPATIRRCYTGALALAALDPGFGLKDLNDYYFT